MIKWHLFLGCRASSAFATATSLGVRTQGTGKFINLPVLSGKSFIYIFKKNFFSMFIYFGDRERQSMNRGGAEREGDTESETGSRL